LQQRKLQFAIVLFERSGSLDGLGAIAGRVKLKLVKVAANDIPGADPDLLVVLVKLTAQNPGQHHDRTGRR
jgi:hypothetical protein